MFLLLLASWTIRPAAPTMINMSGSWFIGLEASDNTEPCTVTERYGQHTSTSLPLRTSLADDPSSAGINTLGCLIVPNTGPTNHPPTRPHQVARKRTNTLESTYVCTCDFEGWRQPPRSQVDRSASSSDRLSLCIQFAGQ
jgi:hypothetical protein